MGLSSTEKSAQRQSVFEKAVGNHPLRMEATPMIQEAFTLWDEVRITNDPWLLDDIERFANRCIEINEPMEKFRQEKAIPHDNEAYQNVIVFTNKWHGNYCTESMQRLASDLHKILEQLEKDVEAITAEIHLYLGANLDGYVQEGNRYNKFKKSIWKFVEQFKEIERVNDLLEKAFKQKIDTEGTCKGAIARAMTALNLLREDFFKHGDHFYGKRSATFLFWTAIISLAVFVMGLANFGLEWWKVSQPQKVEVQLEESINEMLQQGGMIRLPRQNNQ